jgi:hypothetical protein
MEMSSEPDVLATSFLVKEPLSTPSTEKNPAPIGK